MEADSQRAFFSYSRMDSQFAVQLATDLKAAGADVWLDQQDIRGGERWDKAVEVALAGCPRMLVVLSRASVDSDNVMDEVAFALDEKKVLIPVLYQDCRIPFRLRRLQHIDFRNDYPTGLRQLLETMAAAPEPARAGRSNSGAASEPVVSRKESRGLRRLRWSARILSLFIAFITIGLAAETTRTVPLLGTLLLAMFSAGQLAAWKWEWQGSAISVVCALLIESIYGHRQYYPWLFLGIPTILFFLHWMLVRRLKRP